MDTYNINSSRTIAGWVANKQSTGGNPAHIFGSITGWPGGLHAFSYLFLDSGKFLDAAQNWSDPTYGSAKDWCVSRINNMTNAFHHTAFNEDIGNWDVANVSTIISMFQSTTKFDRDLSKWRFASGAEIRWAFRWAIKFNNGGQPLTWNTDGITLMDQMFYGTSFNQDVSSWNLTSCSGLLRMFSACPFNRPLSSWGPQLGKVINMNMMFQDNIDFNQDIGNWDTSSVTDMLNMFNGASNFDNHDRDSIGDWNVASVTGMRGMFQNAINFDRDISDWNVSKVRDMADMFNGAENFDQNISTWVMDVTDGNRSTIIKGMFTGTRSLSVTRNNDIWFAWMKSMGFTPDQLGSNGAGLNDPTLNPSQFGR